MVLGGRYVVWCWVGGSVVLGGRYVVWCWGRGVVLCYSILGFQ